jgi:hypothetical protein
MMEAAVSNLGMLVVVLLPDTLLQTVPDDIALPLVPPLVMTNLRPVASFLNRGAGQRGPGAASLRTVC